jgi:hypothetical protein
MTLQDWLDPSTSSYDFVALQPRKLFRLGAAFLERVRDRLPTESDFDALEVTGRYIDGKATFRDLVEMWARAELASGEHLWAEDVCPCDYCTAAADSDQEVEVRGALSLARSPSAFARHASFGAARLATGGFVGARGTPLWEVFQNERREQYSLYRDLSGDPYAPARRSPLSLAQHQEVQRLLSVIDAQGTIDAMDLLALADAAEEAGCEDAGLLGHLRADTTHFRGCWAVERLAGREVIRLSVDQSAFAPRKRCFPPAW